MLPPASHFNLIFQIQMHIFMQAITQEMETNIHLTSKKDMNWKQQWPETKQWWNLLIYTCLSAPKNKKVYSTRRILIVSNEPYIFLFVYKGRGWGWSWRSRNRGYIMQISAKYSNTNSWPSLMFLVMLLETY